MGECNECSLDSSSDFEGMCEPRRYVPVKCDGCGVIWVDSEGLKLGSVSQLKPCPFCTSVEALRILSESKEGGTGLVYFVRCTGCGCSGPWDESAGQSAEDWNNREQNNDIDDILQERGKRYGKFVEHAMITQMLKGFMQGDVRLAKTAQDDNHLGDLLRNLETKWQALEPDQKEALEMIAHKIGRILNGDPNYADSWDDIAGYAKLVGDRLAGRGEQ